jgi:hypothetical protein
LPRVSARVTAKLIAAPAILRNRMLQLVNHVTHGLASVEADIADPELQSGSQQRWIRSPENGALN